MIGDAMDTDVVSWPPRRHGDDPRTDRDHDNERTPSCTPSASRVVDSIADLIDTLAEGAGFRARHGGGVRRGNVSSWFVFQPTQC